MEVSASMVKSLRQRTGAGFSDCKKALAENDGDVDKAREWLKLRNSKLASSKSDRETSEGVVAYAGDHGNGVLIELLAETDFVASNEQFRGVAAEIANTVLSSRPASSEIKASEMAECSFGNGTLESLRLDAISKIGENIQFGRASALQSEDGSRIFSYVHHNGKIGVIASVVCDDEAIGKDLCMQIAAMRPEVISEEEYSQEHIDKLTKMFENEVAESGKPDEIKGRIVAGKLKKHFEERALLTQDFVKDEKQTVKQLLDSNNAKILAFKSLHIGS